MRPFNSKLLSNLSLSVQLSLIVLLTALPLLATALWMYNELVDKESDNLRQSLVAASKTFAGLVDNEIDTFTAIGRTLSLSEILQRDDLPGFARQATLALEQVPGSWLAISRPDGQQIFNTLVASDQGLPAHGNPNIIKKGFQDQQPQLGDILVGPVAKRPVTYVEIPVFQNSTPKYSLSIAMPPERFLALIQQHFDPSQVVGILDRNLRFVARTPDHAGRVGTIAGEGWRAAIAKSPDGWVETKNLEGNSSVTGYARTQRGWYVGIAVLESEIAAPLNLIFWRTMTVAGFATILSFLAAGVLARRSAMGMREIAGAARGLSEGSYLVEPPKAPFLEAKVISEALFSSSKELKSHAAMQDAHRRQMDLAAREVSHRAKNLLSIVSSIARFLSRDSASVSEYGERFDNRLNALARCQDLLIKNEWTHADLKELIQLQIEPFATGSVTLEGPPVSVVSEDVQSLSMIFHELATNASKYGAWSSAGGDVSITWHRSESQIVLDWIENCVTTPIQKSNKKGFGTTVIRESARALGGDVEVSELPSGRKYSFVLGRIGNRTS